MAHFSGTFFSNALNRPVHFTAVLCNDNQWIDKDSPYYKRPVKNVYLLHGFAGCDTDWFVNAPLGEIANRFNVNFFLPNGDNYFYLDGVESGFKYQTFVGEEFVNYTRKTFGLSDKREDTMIGGLSMGGYGSIHTALAYPETFSKIIALSSALIVKGLSMFKPGPASEHAPANYEYYAHTFGNLDTAASTDRNPEVQIKNLKAAGKQIPDIFMAVGTEDFLMHANEEFKNFLVSEDVPVEYVTGPGVHDFNFWRTYLPVGLEWALK